MALLLTTPDQHGFQDPTLELNEKRLDKRLTALPVLDTCESLRMVLDELEPLNEQQLDTARRLRLLAIYRNAARRLFDIAAPAQLRQQPMSRQQRQDTVDGVERLCLALANGYKIVIKEMYAAKVQESDAGRFGRVLCEGLIQIVTALLHNYRYYRPEPPFAVLELNQLYRLGRHHGIHDTVYGESAGDAPGSLATVYQAICMLALTDPFSAVEGRIERYYEILLQYASKARIIPGNSWQGIPEGLFFIDLQSDSRPRHCVFLESPVQADDPCILDARPALQDMHKALAALPAAKRASRAEVAILRQLLPEVVSREKRRSARRGDGRWIEVVTGLEAIHDWLLRFQRGDDPRAMRWQVKDSSDTGYRLAWNESAASVLQVGELVCIVADSTRARPVFRLVAVRWIRNERGEGTELGVELFEGVPAPVRVAPDDQVQQGHVALFLPSAGGPESVARLVTPQQCYETQRTLTIHAGDRDVRIRCKRLVEQAAGFDYFEFTAGQ